MRWCFCILFSWASYVVYGQALDSTSFDFWLGQWELRWVNADGDTIYGENQVEKILDGRVIQENFADTTGGFYGKSWSTWNPRTGIWRQVWTDNRSSFLEFTGKRHGDTLAFVMAPAKIQGQSRVRRMIFYDITPQRLVWEWQSAPAGTSDWRTMWKIRYQRKP